MVDDKGLLKRRRDRAIATVLSFKEREVDIHLPPEVAQKLRKEILDQINDVCDLALDLLSPEDVIWNELFMQRLDEIHDAVVDDD